MTWSGPVGRPTGPQAPWQGPWGRPGPARPTPHGQFGAGSWSAGPGYRPTGPVYRPTGPVYRPTAAPYRPTGPVYSPNGPTPGYHPQRGGSGCGAALAVVAVIGLIVIAIAVAVMAAAFNSTSSTTSYSPHSTSATSQPPSSQPPSSEPSTSAPPPKPSRTHPDGYYVNDGFAMPPHVFIDPPVPATRDEGAWWRDRAPIYQAVMAAPVRCEVDAAQAESMSDAEIMAIQERYLACLMAAWTPAMQSAGYQFNTPVLLGGRGEAHGPCGQTMSFAGIYCSSIQTIYINLDAFWDDYTTDGLPAYHVEFTLGHEMGHHAQHMTGILISSYWYQQGLSEDEALRENRRMELQANCFAGLGFQSAWTSLGLTEADRSSLLHYRTDSPTHGSAQNRSLWLNQGMNHSEIRQCNTYLMSDDYVA